MGAKKYIRCKIDGCEGGPGNNGTFRHGFCKEHTNAYVSEDIDIDGNPLAKLPNKKKGPTVPNENVDFNRIVKGSVTIDKKASKLIGIAFNSLEDKNNEVLKTEENKKLVNNLKDIKDKGNYLRSSSFVFKNINNLQNRTLKAIINSDSKLLFEGGIKGIDPYDQIMIVKLLNRGEDFDAVCKLYGQYPKSRINLIQTHLNAGTYPMPVEKKKKRKSPTPKRK